MEEHRKLKEDANIKTYMFLMMKSLGIIEHIDIVGVIVDAIFLKHDMSGEEWDD